MDIVIYSKPNCPYCEKIKQVFKLKEYSYVEYVLDTDFTRKQFVEEFGSQGTFPRIRINGTLVGGCNDTISYLKENNLL
jgi:glutaredoxin 3